ncbi:MAG: ABC transporter ATP-binding protein [Candidatus Limnocylindria bacterium]
MVFRLEGVSLRREGRPILCGIDWTVRDGERWVVLGPNGSGKTTLVRILSTYLRASEGSVTILGRELRRTSVHELRREIGYLSPALSVLVPDGLSAAQVVDAAQAGALIPWYLDRASLSRERSLAAMAAVRVSDLAERPYAALSSGEQLRVQIARALVNDPRALLLDEPTANLDIGGRESLIASLSALATGEMAAMVVVMHRVEDIPPDFTHALLLRAGEVVEGGPIEEVLTDEGLSATFGTPLSVARVGPRFVATVRVAQSDGESSSRSIASR